MTLSKHQKELLLIGLPPYGSRGKTAFQMYESLGNKRIQTLKGKRYVATTGNVRRFLKEEAHSEKDSRGRLSFTEKPSYLKEDPKGPSTHANHVADKYD